MKQREVQDQENVRWTCVEALAAISSGLTSDEKGNVTVVCTPSGGSQTVRVKLSADWFDTISDDQLLAEIRQSGKN
jgi:hypothetical protein